LGLSANAWTDFHKVMQNLTQQTFDNFGKAMADVIVDSKSFSDAMKGIWKSLIKSLISEIIALIAKLIVALALKSALGLGGATVGAAASNIASLTKIAGKAASGAMINEPSLVTGLKSGKTILAGEAGAEAIVPLGGGSGGANKTAQEMGTSFAGAMDSGGVTLNVSISGQFLEADESVWQRMFRDKILPEIRRATMSNPTGNFIRRRGATT
jgi:phage-related minor tail protein